MSKNFEATRLAHFDFELGEAPRQRYTDNVYQTIYEQAWFAIQENYDAKHREAEAATRDQEARNEAVGELLSYLPGHLDRVEWRPFCEYIADNFEGKK